MPLYEYRHPKTGEIFEDIRSFSQSDEPYIADDGTKCEKVPIWDGQCRMGLVNNNAEVWQKDPDYVKRMKPKYLRTREGHRIRYDPTKHNGSK